MLFICTHNSARSQMAEGLLRNMYPDRYESFSAGTEATRVHPMAVRVMVEIGIDISGHRSKSVKEFMGREFDYVVTVCSRAKETCPFFPGARQYLHKDFEDPSATTGSEEQMLAAFRRTRDEIKSWVELTFGQAGDDEPKPLEFSLGM